MRLKPLGARSSVPGALVALALTLIAVVLSAWHKTPVLDVPAGAILVLLLPGYAWVNLLQDGEDQPLVRLALVLAASLGITMVVGLIIDLLPQGLDRTDWDLGLGLSAVVAVALTLLRAVAGTDTRPGPGAPSLARGGQVRASGLRRSVSLGSQILILLAAVAGAGWVSLASEATWKAHQQFSALSITASGRGTPVLEVLNHERQMATYHVSARLDGRPVFDTQLAVAAGRTRRLDLTQVRPPRGTGRLTVVLDQVGHRAPYRQVWVRTAGGRWL